MTKKDMEGSPTKEKENRGKRDKFVTTRTHNEVKKARHTDLLVKSKEHQHKIQGSPRKKKENRFKSEKVLSIHKNNEVQKEPLKGQLQKCKEHQNINQGGPTKTKENKYKLDKLLTTSTNQETPTQKKNPGGTTKTKGTALPPKETKKKN